MSRLSEACLDQILAYQICVAWAGEALCEPRRLGWWRTDLVDELGGGDLFARLLPKTAEWSGRQAVRQAAIQTDARLRQERPDADRIRTLFFWGFDIDEQLSDRVSAHKKSKSAPQDVLPLPLNLTEPFTLRAFEAAIADKVNIEITPNGRAVQGKMPITPEQQAKKLAAALVNPTPEQYPMPFYRLQG